MVGIAHDDEPLDVWVDDGLPPATRHWVLAGAVVAALLPLVVAAGHLFGAVGDSYLPTVDRALMELQVRDVGHHAVLLGPYSRFGWHHPGPLLFYLLAVPYWLSGDRSIGLLLGALCINAAAVVGIAFVARRRGGTVLMLLVLVLIGLLMNALGPDAVRDAWNPYVTLLPFALYVLVVWSLAVGDAWGLPVAAGLATFLVQSHVGYALVVATLLLWAVVWFAIGVARSRSDEEHWPSRLRALRWAGVSTAAVLAVLWAPAIAEQLSSSGGNASAIFHFFRDHDGDHSLLDGYRVTALQLGLRPQWITGVSSTSITGEIVIPDPAPLILWFAAAVFAGAAAWRRHQRAALQLVAIACIATLAAIVAVSRIAGPLGTYLVQWHWVVGFTVVLAAVWAALSALASRQRRIAARVAVPVLAVTLAALSVVNVVGALDTETPERVDAGLINGLTQPVLGWLPPGDGPVLIKSNFLTTLFFTSGLALQLERHGVPVRVEPAYAFLFDARRAEKSPEVRAVLTVVQGTDPRLAAIRARPDQELIVRFERPHFPPESVDAFERRIRRDASNPKELREQLTIVDRLRKERDVIFVFGSRVVHSEQP